MTAQTRELAELAQKLRPKSPLKIGVTETARHPAKSPDLEIELWLSGWIWRSHDVDFIFRVAIACAIFLNVTAVISPLVRRRPRGF